MIGTHNQMFRLCMALVMCLVAVRLFSDVRNATKTGVAHIVGQASKGFDRTQQPLQFWGAISLALVFAIFLLSAALLIAWEFVLSIVLEH